MAADTEDRAARLGPYFALQLAVAHRMAELTGQPLGLMVLEHTNFHRRLGFGRASKGLSPHWGPYAQALEHTAGIPAQVALTQAEMRRHPPEQTPGPGRTSFGCFACDDAPASDGGVQIHFYNHDTDADGGPLAETKLPRRRAEMAAVVRHVRHAMPQATHIRGRSWLYNLAAYRRVFAPEYGASARPVAPEPVSLSGNSLWGQVIDSQERLKPAARDAVLAALPSLEAERPWAIFPLGALTTFAPLEAFERFYGL